MADPTFNLFGPPQKNDITVGYISTDRGMVSNVTICEANDYAKINPGTVFIYKTRKEIKFLNINEVNRIQPTDKNIPDPCEGGLKLEFNWEKQANNTYKVFANLI